MTPESQRIAIAQACPGLFVHIPSPFGPGGVHWREGKDDNGKTVSPGAHVDVLNDLNAMHEAEKVLLEKSDGVSPPDLFDDYCQRLGGSLFHCTHATAAQRAEAFLGTLGLWVEEPASVATVEGLR